MVYIKENGVTVEDSPLGTGSVMVMTDSETLNERTFSYSAPVCDALLRGLLRWKLENEGVDACKRWFADTMTDALLGPDPEKGR